MIPTETGFLGLGLADGGGSGGAHFQNTPPTAERHAGPGLMKQR